MTPVEVCGATFSRCACALDPHGDDVAHVCGAASVVGDGSGCGGSWFGVSGTASLRVVSFPAAFGDMIAALLGMPVESDEDEVLP